MAEPLLLLEAAQSGLAIPKCRPRKGMQRCSLWRFHPAGNSSPRLCTHGLESTEVTWVRGGRVRVELEHSDVISMMWGCWCGVVPRRVRIGGVGRKISDTAQIQCGSLFNVALSRATQPPRHTISLSNSSRYEWQWQSVVRSNESGLRSSRSEPKL